MTDLVGSWSRGLNFYVKMRRKHSRLWRFVPSWLQALRVGRLLEVGCGEAYAAQFVDSYFGIELNEEIAAWARVHARARSETRIVVADWLSMDLAEMEGRFDAVMALAVVEHCPDYGPFLERVLAIRPRVALITFFRGLNRPQDVIRPGRPKRGIRDYWDNAYSRPRLVRWLNEHGLGGRYLALPFRDEKGYASKETILTFCTGDDAERACWYRAIEPLLRREISASCAT